jgi:hypothetical protein
LKALTIGWLSESRVHHAAAVVGRKCTRFKNSATERSTGSPAESYGDLRRCAALKPLLGQHEQQTYLVRSASHQHVIRLTERRMDEYVYESTHVNLYAWSSTK